MSALAAGVLAAQALGAQEQAPQTHTVKPGDTLWDLAKQYMGDPFLWPEIYRLNRDVVEDPHWIFPGEVLRLPGAGGPPPVAQLPSGGIQGPTAPAVTPTPGAPGAGAAIPAPPGGLQTTVFGRTAAAAGPTAMTVDASIVNGGPLPTVRAGEVMSAPYVDREGGPRGFGRILKSGDIAGVEEATERLRFQAYDRVFIMPPAGEIAPEGERYLAYRLGPILEDQGQIVIPTGIVEVTRAAMSGTAAVAKVVKAFTELNVSDRLVPLDTIGISTTIRPERVVNGPSTHVAWIYGEPVLASVQNFVVLHTSSHQGVRMGDEFLIYLPSYHEEGQLAEPEVPIGKAQVVRSTPYGVTAVILGQDQPAIREGMAARVVARMP